MKQKSILRQLYIEQKQPVNEQQETIPHQYNNNLFFLIWILIGALLSGIILVPFFVLYVRKQESSSTDSTIVNQTTITTTAFSLWWNSTGVIAAGISGSPGRNANQLNNPYGLALDSSSSLYIVDRLNNRVQKYLSGASSGSTVSGQASGTSGTLAAYLNQPGYITVDSNNNVYVSDSNNNRVQFWANGSSSGITIAGTGINGSALNQFDSPKGIALDSISGTLYIADQYNHRIMCYTSGAVTGVLVAGGSGPGTSSTQLNQPVGVQFDISSNSLFISNHGSHTIVRWMLGASSWTLVAGSSGLSGASSTLLNYPAGVVSDSMGNVYVADTSNSRIQLFLSGQTNGSTIAGITGTAGSNLSLLSNPYWVSLDTQLNLYVSDRDNDRVLKFLHY